jgi:transcriptional regulator with XRE-family HTH domain
MPSVTKPFQGRSGRVRVKGKDIDAPSRDIGYEQKRKVGAYLSDLRIAKGLTQEELGRILGVRNTYLSGVELGRNSLSPELTLPTAEALGVNPKTFARKILRHYNPWIYTMIYDDVTLEEEIASIPHRVQDLRNGVH